MAANNSSNSRIPPVPQPLEASDSPSAMTAEELGNIFLQIYHEALGAARLQLQKQAAEKDLERKENTFKVSGLIREKFSEVGRFQQQEIAVAADSIKSFAQQLAEKDAKLKECTQQGASRLLSIVANAKPFVQPSTYSDDPKILKRIADVEKACKDQQRHLLDPKVPQRVEDISRRCDNLQRQLSEQQKFITEQRAARERLEKENRELKDSIATVSSRQTSHDKSFNAFRQETVGKLSNNDVEIGALKGSVTDMNTQRSRMQEASEQQQLRLDSLSGVPARLEAIASEMHDKKTSIRGDVKSRDDLERTVQKFRVALYGDKDVGTTGLMDYITRLAKDQAVFRDKIGEINEAVESLQTSASSMNSLHDRFGPLETKLRNLELSMLQKSDKAEVVTMVENLQREARSQVANNQATIQDNVIEKIEALTNKVASLEKSNHHGNDTTASSGPTTGPISAEIDLDGLKSEILAIVESKQEAYDSVVEGLFENLQGPIEELKSRVESLEKQSPLEPKTTPPQELQMLPASVQSLQEELTRLRADLNNALTNLPQDVVGHTKQAVNNLNVYLQNDYNGKISGVTQAQQKQFENLDFRISSITSRVDNINTKDMAEYILSTLTESLPAFQKLQAQIDRQKITSEGLRAGVEQIRESLQKTSTSLGARIETIEARAGSAQVDQKVIDHLRQDWISTTQKLNNTQAHLTTIQDDVKKIRDQENGLENLIKECGAAQKQVEREVANVFAPVIDDLRELKEKTKALEMREKERSEAQKRAKEQQQMRPTAPIGIPRARSGNIPLNHRQPSLAGEKRKLHNGHSHSPPVNGRTNGSSSNKHVPKKARIADSDQSDGDEIAEPTKHEFLTSDDDD